MSIQSSSTTFLPALKQQGFLPVKCEKMIVAALEVAKERGFETDTVFISNEEVAPCKACGACREKDFCVIDDEWKKFMKK